MLTIPESIGRINDVINELQSNRSNEVKIIAADALALVKDRVIQRNEDADGNSFGGYSQAVVPVYFYKGRSRTGSDAAYRKVQKKGYFASYKDWREANNLQTSGKDFFFTGRMWGSIKPNVTTNSNGATTVRIAATNKDGQDKLEYVSAQSGNILRLSESERQFLQQANAERVQRYLSNLR